MGVGWPGGPTERRQRVMDQDRCRLYILGSSLFSFFFFRDDIKEEWAKGRGIGRRLRAGLGVFFSLFFPLFFFFFFS